MAGWLQERKRRYLEDGWEEFDAEEFKSKQAAEKQRQTERQTHELQGGEHRSHIAVGLGLLTIVGLLSFRQKWKPHSLPV